jgi:hypothetical protein
MKMRDKALFRFLAVQYLDGYKAMVNTFRKDDGLNQLIKRLEDNKFTNIDIEDSFWREIILCLDYKVKGENNLLYEIGELEYVIQEGESLLENLVFSLDLNRLSQHVNDYIDKEYTKQINNSSNRDERLKILKTMKCCEDSQKRLLEMLIVMSWEIIDKYFPIDVYGILDKNVWVEIINNICGNQLVIYGEFASLRNTIDIDMLMIKLENKMLWDVINKHGINIEADMLRSQDLHRSIILKELLLKNPIYSIEVNLNMNKSSLHQEYSDYIFKKIKKINKTLGIERLQSDIKTIDLRCWLYVDRKFNRELSDGQIAKELIELGEQLGSKNHSKLNPYEKHLYEKAVSGFGSINEEIKELSTQVGLKEELEMINKKNTEKQNGK